MEPGTTTVVDLAGLERRLALRAEFHDHPASYRDGVRDVMAALQDHAVEGGLARRPTEPGTRAG